jgi:hypothetical protein
MARILSTRVIAVEANLASTLCPHLPVKYQQEVAGNQLALVANLRMAAMAARRIALQAMVMELQAMAMTVDHQAMATNHRAAVMDHQVGRQMVGMGHPTTPGPKNRLSMVTSSL